MSITKRVLVTLTFPPEMVAGFDSYVKKFEQQGFKVDIEPSYSRVPEDKLIEILQGTYAHIVGSETISKAVMEACPDVKVFSRMGAGYDTVDIKEATNRGIAVTTTPGANAEAVGEFAFALMISLTRRIVEFDKHTRNGVWKTMFGASLLRKTVGLIGLGNIGKVVAKLLSGFDVKILVYDPYADQKYTAAHNIELCSLDKLCSESDYISVHCPLTKDTCNLLSEKEFALMKPSVRIINAARGEIIDEKVLIEALREKRIAGAALDCFVDEPVHMDNPLFGLNNVILTSHTAGMTYEGRGKVIEMAFQNVIDVSEGRVPRGIVNPDFIKVAKK